MTQSLLPLGLRKRLARCEPKDRFRIGKYAPDICRRLFSEGYLTYEHHSDYQGVRTTKMPPLPNSANAVPLPSHGAPELAWLMVMSQLQQRWNMLLYRDPNTMTWTLPTPSWLSFRYIRRPEPPRFYVEKGLLHYRGVNDPREEWKTRNRQYVGQIPAVVATRLGTEFRKDWVRFLYLTGLVRLECKLLLDSQIMTVIPPFNSKEDV